MILILSDKTDFSTSEVMDWLFYYNKVIIRINGNDDIKINIQKDNKNLDTIYIEKKDINFQLNAITSYWYRRGNFNYELPRLNINYSVTNYLNKYFEIERQAVQYHLHYLLKNKRGIGSYFDNAINKLSVLHSAAKLDLIIPDTIITGERQQALLFSQKYQRVIHKGISESFNIKLPDNTQSYLHTIMLTSDDINKFPEKFAPILLQECLDKKYELRIFYLHGKCYSSVIFSQNDPKTKIDLRNGNNKRPNRICPYRLPSNVANKIKKLMQRFDFNSGSIDMVITKNNNYVFLEINPVGQFKQVSEPCNYFLENEIALKLQ